MTTKSTVHFRRADGAVLRFLIDADLPRSLVRVLQDQGHDAIDVRDIGLGAATDAEIASHARRMDLCLITGDFDFADVRNYPPADYAGLVVVSPPRGANAVVIGELVGAFIRQPHLASQVTGRLVIIEPGRVRIRSR